MAAAGTMRTMGRYAKYITHDVKPSHKDDEDGSHFCLKNSKKTFTLVLFWHIRQPFCLNVCFFGKLYMMFFSWSVFGTSREINHDLFDLSAETADPRSSHPLPRQKWTREGLMCSFVLLCTSNFHET